MLTPQSVVERYCGQVRTCIQMALRCVDPDRLNRPSIGEVVAVLEAAELEALLENTSWEPVRNTLRHRFSNRFPQTETNGLVFRHRIFQQVP